MTGNWQNYDFGQMGVISRREEIEEEMAIVKNYQRRLW